MLSPLMAAACNGPSLAVKPFQKEPRKHEICVLLSVLLFAVGTGEPPEKSCSSNRGLISHCEKEEFSSS